MLSSVKSRTEYSILNIITGIGGYAINTILGFVCRMVFVRYLSSEYLGVSGLFTNILSMLSLAELGIGSAIIYALYKPIAENDKEKIASLMKFYGKSYRIIGTIIILFGLAMMPFLNIVITDTPNIKENLYFIYIIYLFNTSLTYFFSYKSSLIMAVQQNYIVTGLNYIITILQSILQILYLCITREYMGYLIIQTLGAFVYNIIITYIANKKFPYLKNEDIKPLTKEEKHVLTGNIKALTIWKLSGLLVNNTDNIIITYFSGLSTVGLSSNYTLLSTTLSSLLNQIFNGLTASIGNFNASETKEKKLNLFNFINLINFWLFGWATIGIVVLSTDIINLCFGENYILPIYIPYIIALNFYTVGMQSTVWMYKNTMGIFRQGRYLLLVTAILNLVLSMYLGNLWGLFGILLATFISRSFTNIWYDPYCVFKYGLKENPITYLKKYIKYFIILIITLKTCITICDFIDLSLWQTIIAKVIACSTITNVLFFLFFYKTTEFKRVLNICVNLKRKIILKV